MLIRKCKVCGKEFKTYPSRVKNGFAIYCSRECKDKTLGEKKIALGSHFKVRDEKNVMWKGNNASYSAFHKWVIVRMGKPCFCEICGSQNKKKYEWASKSHKFLRDLSDWIRLCTSCHRKYDIENNGYEIGFLGMNNYWNIKQNGNHKT